MMRNKRVLLTFIISFVVTVGYGQLENRIFDYYQKVPREKVYIQTDRSYYATGDTIWFRVHIVDAATNIPSTSPLYPTGRSNFVYVELYENRTDSLLERAMIKKDSAGVFANAMALPMDITGGGYTLVAYTRQMMNYSNKFFAYSHIQIVGECVPPEPDYQEVLPLVSIEALPEGGSLVAGHRQRLAFKVTDGQSVGIDADVRLVDKSDETIVIEGKTEYNGMGSVYFTPQNNRHYRLEAYTGYGVSCYTDIPCASPVGVTLSVSQRKGRLYIVPISENVDLSKLTLVIYGSGNFLSKYNLTDKTIVIDTASFNHGIVNVAVIDEKDSKVYASRLVFIK